MAEQAAVAAANTILDAESVEAQEAPASEPTEPAAETSPEAPQEAEEEVLPEEVPDEIKDIWETPDFEEEAEAEVRAEAPEEEEVYEDEETATLRKELKAAQKKIAWQEEQKLKESAPRWKKEALKYTPYCEPFIEEIAAKATSRRGLLREAKRVNDVVEAWANERFTKPSEEQLEAIREELRAEVKAEATAAWGEPTVTPAGVPAEASEARQKLEELRNAGAPLEKLILARKDAGDFDNL